MTSPLPPASAFRHFAPLLILVLLAMPGLGQEGGGAADDPVRAFDAFVTAYRNAEPGEQDGLLREYRERQPGAGGFPIAGEGEAIFLWAGSDGMGAENLGEVRLVGDFAMPNRYEYSWDPAGVNLEPVVAGGNLGFVRLKVEPDARLDYAFQVSEDRIPDPLNRRRIFSGVGGGEVSELVMPGYRFDPAVAERGDPPAGTLEVLDAPWASPKVTVYLPPGYDPAGDYPTVYTADGSAWVEYLELPRTLDALIAAGRIEPLVAVMIDSKEFRRRWYYYKPDYLSYLERVVTEVDRRYATRPEPAARLHAGTSAGARAALFAALERPDLFHLVGALSPALYGPPSWWHQHLTADHPPAPLSLWVSAGSYEGVVAEDAELLAHLFRRWNLPATHVTTPEGHSFGAWRNHAPRMLEHFFPPR